MKYLKQSWKQNISKDQNYYRIDWFDLSLSHYNKSNIKKGMIKAMKEEEERKKKIEFIKIKEWEEKFDKEQKMKEEEERLREERLRKRELESLKRQEVEEKEVKEELANRLKTFNIDKTTKN